jgi:hypothetical protein
MQKSATVSAASTVIARSAQASVHSLQKIKPAVYPPKMVSAGHRLRLMPGSRAGSNGGRRGSASISAQVVSTKLISIECRN